MKAELFKNLVRLLAGAALSAVLFSAPFAGGVLKVHASQSDDDDDDKRNKDDLEKLRRLGDYLGTELVRPFLYLVYGPDVLHRDVLILIDEEDACQCGVDDLHDLILSALDVL